VTSNFILLDGILSRIPYLGGGGLSVRDRRLFNEALLGKWLWRYTNVKDSIWRRVVRIKYGGNGIGWYPSKPSGAYGQSLWRFIHKGWGRFYHHFSFKAGVGSSILFWHDC